MRDIQAATALQLLICFRRRQIGLSRKIYDQCFDAVTDELERINNEVYRLQDDEDPEAT